jgi:hypothetical protein
VPKARVFRLAGVGWLGFLAVWGIMLADCVYRKNNNCGPDNGPIASNMDAIVRAQKSISKARYLSQDPGYDNDKPYVVDFGPAKTCCSATRWRTGFGVIVWDVSLNGETIGEVRNRHFSAQILVSNCGVVFDDDSVIFADPITR